MIFLGTEVHPVLLHRLPHVPPGTALPEGALQGARLGLHGESCLVPACMVSSSIGCGVTFCVGCTTAAQFKQAQESGFLA